MNGSLNVLDVYDLPRGVPALKVENLTRRFRRDDGKRPGLFKRRPFFAALDDITLAVMPGQIFGLIGMNGSGKSTFIRVISTLLVPDGGSVEVFGHDVGKDPQPVRDIIGRVSADAPFFKVLSSDENLRFCASLYGITPAQAKTRYTAILKRIGLEPKVLTDQVNSLSRGMRQKVALARAFMTAPALLLLDEPTTGLDPRSKREVQRAILETRDAEGTTILLTTHDMEEAERLCDNVAIIHEGKIVAMGTAGELMISAGNGGGAVSTLEKAFLKFTGAEWLSEEDRD